MKKITLFTCSATASLLLVAGSVSADDDFDWRRWGNSIEGAWQVEVTLRLPTEDCATAPIVPVGPAGFPSIFPMFNTFHQGGTMSEWGSRVPPARRSSGHGVWERTGSHKYGFRDMFHSFDEDGILIATMDITADMKLSRNGDSFTAVSHFVRTELTGVVRNFCATMNGERIVL